MREKPEGSDNCRVSINHQDNRKSKQIWRVEFIKSYARIIPIKKDLQPSIAVNPWYFHGRHDWIWTNDLYRVKVALSPWATCLYFWKSVNTSCLACQEKCPNKAPGPTNDRSDYKRFVISAANRCIGINSLRKNLLENPPCNFRHPTSQENRLSLKAALPGYGRIGDRLPFHRHFWRQGPQNNGSTFRIDIRRWAFKTSRN